MNNDHGEPTADTWTHGPTGNDREAEIERLRERLAFYESFDRLIQENIARSGDLLRQAVELRETVARELTEAEQRRASERSYYRALVATLLDAVVELQGQTERLARQLSDALDELEAELPPRAVLSLAQPFERGAPPRQLPGAEPPRLTPQPPPEGAYDEQSALPAAAEPAAAEVPEGPAGAVDDTILAAPDLDSVADHTGAEPTAVSEAKTESWADTLLLTPAEAATLARDQPGPKIGTPPSDVGEPATTIPPVAAEPPPDTSTPRERRSTIVLVHGVPRATAALSLKRYLEGLPHVATVEPREFAEGILRLQVTGDRPLVIDDLRRWPEGAGLEPVHVRDDLVEVRLPR